MPCLALLILPLLVVARAWSRPMLPPPIIPAASKPYLGAIGAPPVRFQEPEPPPDLVTRPAAGAPPQPVAKDAPVADVTPIPETSSSATSIATVPSAAPAATPADSAATPEAEAPASAHTPPPILRDEIHRPTRAEDFLPFFQIPTPQPGDVTVVPVPRGANPPAPLPASSATYTQTPK